MQEEKRRQNWWALYWPIQDREISRCVLGDECWGPAKQCAITLKKPYNSSPQSPPIQPAQPDAGSNSSPNADSASLQSSPCADSIPPLSVYGSIKELLWMYTWATMQTEKKMSSRQRLRAWSSQQNLHWRWPAHTEMPSDRIHDHQPELHSSTRPVGSVATTWLVDCIYRCCSTEFSEGTTPLRGVPSHASPQDESERDEHTSPVW